MVELEGKTSESEISKNIRSFKITDGEIIKLEGITDYKWKIYEPLLNALRTTRIQTESGEVQISPISYEKVRSLFPKGTRWTTIYNSLQTLNNSLAPSGWSILRQGEATNKPINAPWFLSGPDHNGAQNKGQPKPKKENSHDRTVREERREAALKQFEPLTFGTKLLHSCVSIFTNPDAQAICTKDVSRLMSSLLPKELNLKDLIGNKTPEEYFQERIEEAINRIKGKPYKTLSEKQKLIIPLWRQLENEPGQHPKTVIFEHFGIQPTSSPAPGSPKDVIHS